MNTNSKNRGIRILVMAAAAGVLFFAAVGFTGAAAQSAIPGDALYPVKTTIEQSRLYMAADAGERAQLRMLYAEQRLGEIEALIQEGRFTEMRAAVLAFESSIHSAILELGTISQTDPTRSAQLAMEITSALTRYAQTLSFMAANAPQSVASEVQRALETTQIASGLEMPVASPESDDNSNDNANLNGDDSNSNDDDNSNGDDNSNDANSNDDNSNSDCDDENSNEDCSGDESNENSADGSNTNSDDDSSNSNGDDGSNDNGDDDSGNDSGDDNGGSGGGGNDNGGDDD